MNTDSPVGLNACTTDGTTHTGLNACAPAVAMLAAALWAGCATPPRPAVRDLPAVAVATAPVEARELASTFDAGGVVRARTTAVIASRVMAPITQVHVRAGDRVRRGAALVTLDDRDLVANKARADAASVAAVESATAAEGDVRAAESAVQLARVTHDRIAALHAARSATPQELDQAVAGLTGAEAQRASAQARLAAAVASRDAARAGAEAASVAATFTTLTAPFDGIVAERNADPGSMATPGAPLLTIEDAGAYRLEAQIDEARAALVTVGESADARLDGAVDAAWQPTKVVEVARVDPASHNFLVKVDLPAAAGLRSGLFGRVRFNGPSRRALTVPASAVVKRGQLTFVFLADADKHARLRSISPGAAAGDSIEVLAGLQPGDAVVVQPPPALGDGSTLGARP